MDVARKKKCLSDWFAQQGKPVKAHKPPGRRASYVAWPHHARSLDFSTSAQDEGSLALSKFLDLVWEDVEQNPDKLVPYTHELDAELDELLSGVEVD